MEYQKYSVMNSELIKDYLHEWDSSVSNVYLEDLNKTASRREFLKQLMVGSAAIVFSNNVLANLDKLHDDIWESFSSLHFHLFPASDNSPDAKTINATAYLKSITEWPGVDKSDKKFIIDGVSWLNGVANKLYKQQFKDLNVDQKETVLRLVEKSRAGENWLALILLYLMEALLTDPVYGGNVNGAGWKWLEHQPGFPRPAANKRYFNL